MLTININYIHADTEHTNKLYPDKFCFFFALEHPVIIT